MSQDEVRALIIQCGFVLALDIGPLDMRLTGIVNVQQRGKWTWPIGIPANLMNYIRARRRDSRGVAV